MGKEHLLGITFSHFSYFLGGGNFLSSSFFSSSFLSIIGLQTLKISLIKLPTKQCFVLASISLKTGSVTRNNKSFNILIFMVK